VEEDGQGLPPDDLRAHFLRAGGYWQVRVLTPEKAKAVHIVRRVLDLPITEAGRLLNGFPLMPRGTIAEAKFLAAQLTLEGVAAEAEPCDERFRD
jgi:hypothetical protein